MSILVYTSRIICFLFALRNRDCCLFVYKQNVKILTLREKSLDGYSYSIMISAFCRSGLLQEAKELVCQVEAKFKSYDVIMLNTMLCAYCRVGEMENVMKMLKRMDELAITPDWNTFHILIKYFCKEKIYMLAYQTLEDMHRKGHQPEEVLYSFAT